MLSIDQKEKKKKKKRRSRFLFFSLWIFADRFLSSRTYDDDEGHTHTHVDGDIKEEEELLVLGWRWCCFSRHSCATFSPRFSGPRSLSTGLFLLLSPVFIFFFSSPSPSSSRLLSAWFPFQVDPPHHGPPMCYILRHSLTGGKPTNFIHSPAI